MSVNPSPIGGFAAQFFDNNGQPLSGGKIYTYAAGTTTPQATYTSALGVTPHANPIVLDSAGRVPGGEIWLTDSLVYKFVIETSLAVLIGTYDNIIGVNSNFVNYTVQEEVITATAGQTVFNLSTINYTPGTNSLSVYIDGVNQYVGDSYLETDSNTVTFTSGLHVGAEVKFTTAVQTTTGAVDANDVGYTANYTGATGQTVQTKLEQYVSVKDFGAVGDGVADDTVAIQAAVNSGAGAVYVPGTASYYKLTDEITVPDSVTVYGDGWRSFVQQTTLNKDVFIAGNSNTFRALRLKIQDGDNSDFVNCIYAADVNNFSVLDCFLESADLGGCGVHIRNVQNSLVRGNRIYGGKWSGGVGPAAGATDIMLYSFGASERHVIEGNFCLSNNSQGIGVDPLGFDGDIIIANNVCVTLDPATCTEGGTWALAASGGVRRHGIILNYNPSTVSGPRAVVTGNICRNTRWTGIYKPGLSASGIIIANNLCDLNGYEPGNSLAGGIHINQSGGEQIIGNYITNYQNVGNGTGGITINSGLSPTEPSSVVGNTVSGSLGYGIVLVNKATFVTVAENTLFDNANTDIASGPSSGFADIAGHDIKNNRIKRTSDTAPAIFIDLQNSTQITFVRGNRITGPNNTTATQDNAAIQLNNASVYNRVTDNVIDNFYYGLYCKTYYTTAARGSDFVYERNTLINCNTGFVIAGTTTGQTIPLIDNRFIDVTTKVTGAPLGDTAGRIVARLGDSFTWQTTAVPSIGTWAVGDRSINTAPAIGSPKGWVCTVAGTPGTWVSTGNL